jgi:hypothetical protein
MRKLLFALLIEVAPAGDPPPPDRLRLTGTRCHDSAEGRVFELQSATIRDRPHWQTPITEGATPLHITWTPATRNDLGQTMTGGWRIDVSTDLAELNGGDGPRVARANFDSPIPPFGTRHPDECTDKYYCMESGGGWREKCDGEYGLSPIVLEQHFSADACEECAAGCPLNDDPDGGAGPGAAGGPRADVAEVVLLLRPQGSAHQRLLSRQEEGGVRIRQ